MTEEEWFASADVLKMLAHLGERASDRKLRLFGCHCLRALGDKLPFESQECVKYAEKYVDGLLKWTEAYNRILSRTQHPDFPFLRWLPFCLVRAGAMDAARDAAFWVGAPHYWDRSWTDWSEYVAHGPPFRWVATYTRSLAPLLREIVGNPFRPAAFSPSWRTDTAVMLARQMYEAREFSAMPILADALQDAGCDNEDVLSHCRDSHATHVRGCWVLDLVLGKL